MDIFLKAVTGAVIVLLIHLAATSKNYYLAGLIPLFPTFSLIAHYMVGTERTVSDLSNTILFGIFALIPMLVYLITLYLLITRYDLLVSLFTSTISWGLAAVLLVLVWDSKTENHIADNQLSTATELTKEVSKKSFRVS